MLAVVALALAVACPRAARVILVVAEAKRCRGAREAAEDEQERGGGEHSSASGGATTVGATRTVQYGTRRVTRTAFWLLS